MRRHMAGAIAVLSVCLAAGALYADYDQAFGQIKSVDVDAGKLVVAVRVARGQDPKEVTYLVDKDTTVRINREKKAGKRASIVFKEAEKDGELAKALLITIRERRPRGDRKK